MAETLTLTTPGSITGYQIIKMTFNWELATITILVRDTNDFRIKCIYTDLTATTLMNQMNVIDSSTISLHRRILERLVTDGKLPAGTVTGTPD